MSDLAAVLLRLQERARLKPDQLHLADGPDGVTYWWQTNSVPEGHGNSTDLVALTSEDVIINEARLKTVLDELAPVFGFLDTSKVQGRQGYKVRLCRFPTCTCGNRIDTAALLYGDGELCTGCGVRARAGKTREVAV